ncbi:MAG: serine/threonine-protein kinase [Aureliella sp.]
MSKMRSSSEVWRAISELEIAGAQVCRDWASEVAAILSPEDLASGPKTIDALAEKGYLTPFQAAAFQRGDAERELRAGRWLVLEPVAGLSPTGQTDALWNDWFSAKDSSENLAWIRRVSGHELQQLQSSQPSIERSNQLAKLESESVHRVWSTEVASGALISAVRPVEGELLVDVVQKNAAQALGPSARWQLFRELVEATAQLHRSGIVHGRIAPDRCLVRDGRGKLLIDPLCGRAGMPGAESAGIIGTKLQSMALEHFIAPEFLAPDPVPSKASDVFALGCLWWWLLDGRPVSSAAAPDAVMADHAGPLPKVTDRIAAYKQWTPEYETCMQHALSRNLAARFADAEKLLAAIVAAEEPVQSASQSGVEQPVGSKVGSKKTRQQKSASATKQPAKSEPRAKDPVLGVAPVETTKPTDKREKALEKVSQDVLADRDESPTTEPARGEVAKGQTEQSSLAESAAVQDASLAAEKEGETTAVTKVASKKSTSGAAATQAKPARSTRTRRSRAKSNKWMLPVIGGSGFLIVLLAVLKLSGALEFTAAEEAAKPAAPYQPAAVRSDTAPARPEFPAAEQFNVVESDSGLWLPPAIPSPVPVDMLPPGGQLFVSIRSGWLDPDAPVAAALGNRLDPLRGLLTRYGGISTDAWQQATVAFYGPSSPGAFPRVAVRYQLKQPASVDELASNWPSASVAMVDGNQFYAAGELLYYYRAAEDGTISEFSSGAVAQMQEVVEFGGEAGPMTPAIEQLWKLSDAEADLATFGAPQYLFTIGRELLQRSPPRFADTIETLLATDRRATLLQTRFMPNWYVETAVVGRGAASAANIAQELRDSVASWPQAVEQWFVDQSPHPAWRGIALRYAPMLRAASSQLRYGVEDGVAKANFYLPSLAAPNLVLAVWLASQPGATQVESGAVAASPQSSPPLTTEQYLQRKIRLSFAQEPIEVALQLVADEANDSLPAGTQPMRFELDGDAFELAGITRNQQLRDFSHDGSTVRDVLTDIARRGNPVTTVTDTREDDQQLIWVVRPDPDSPERAIVSLTTRTTASTRGDTLPSEFAPAAE